MSEHVHVTIGPRGRVVALSGDLDLAVAPPVKEALSSIAGDVPSGEVLTLDVEQVTFVDSTMLGVLVGVHRELATRGAALALLRPRAHFAKLLDITGLSEIIVTE
jgi:anti-sigma B factor antagonist